MRAIKHRPISDFKLMMSKALFHPVIGHYCMRSDDRGWRQLYETADGVPLTLDGRGRLDEITVARWQDLFNNFDSMVDAALRVIPPPWADPDSFDVDDLVIRHIYLVDPIQFLFDSEYCQEYNERPEVVFVDGLARFDMWST